MAKPSKKAQQPVVGELRGNPLEKPVRVTLPDGIDFYIKIDAIYLKDGSFAINGWATTPLKFYIETDGKALDPKFSEKLLREDVNEALELDDDESRGFAIAAEITKDAKPNLFVKPETGNIFLRVPLDYAQAGTVLDESYKELMGDDIYEWLEEKEEEARESLGGSGLRANLDQAIRLKNPQLGNLLIVRGWATLPPGVQLYISDDNGGFSKPLNPSFHPREDINEKYGICANPDQRGQGFLGAVEDFPASEKTVTLTAVRGDTAIAIASRKIENKNTFNSFIKSIFELDIHWTELARNYKTALLEPLARMNARNRALVNSAALDEGHIGDLPANPRTSVIIPIYGVLSLLRPQLLCFSEDPAFRENVELIFVIDDLRMLDGFLTSIDELWQFFHIPCRWVYRAANLGFSGANNLGASVARGGTLIFLNSDVFPEEPGWTNRFADYLEAHPDVGIAGCRLLYPNGSIQHAGMVHKYRAALGIWTNIHPWLGCGEEFDPATGPVEMRAVTGACMAIRREVFDAVGGWSEDYIIGDFEDSDMCFKILAHGKKIVYLPDIRLTHLERQSFITLGEDTFRQRLTIFNAVTHQTKWGAMFEQMNEPEMPKIDEPVINPPPQTQDLDEPEIVEITIETLEE